MPAKDKGYPQVGETKVADKRKRRGKRTTKNSTTSPRSIRFRRQAAEAIDYRLLGYTFEQIGKEMGFDKSYAYRLVDWAMTETVAEPVERLRKIMRMRLEAMMTGVMDKAISGDGEAQDHARRTMEIQAKLDGLFAPTKLEHSGEVQGGQPVIVQISVDDAKV
jgi:hypothetical protein